MKITRNVLVFLLCLSIKLTYSQSTTSEISQDTVKLELRPQSNLDTNNFNIFPKKFTKKKVALVLSGGGARGIAQLGVIKVLEKNNIEPDLIVGTSVGSMIGGFYASGYRPDEIENIFESFDWNIALSLTNKYQRTSLFPEQKKVQDRSLLTIPLDGIKPVLLPSSLSNGHYLSEQINSFVLNSRYHPKKDFSDLKIPFAAVATDLDNGKRVILTKGNLSESIKASLTFPLLYTPINIEGRNLVDGGLSANIPNDVAKKLGADFTIVVNSTSPLKTKSELEGALNTADQILSITMSQLNSLQLKDAGVIITPDLKNYSATDFSNFSSLIKKGEEKTETLIETIQSKIDSMELSSSKYFNYFITNPTVTVNSEFDSEIYKSKLLKITDKTFERYTSIEKNLKDFYKTGLFEDVFAIVTREDMNAVVAYELISNPILENITVSNRIEILDSTIERYKIKNLNKPINTIEFEKLYDDLLGILRKNSLSLIDINRFYFNYNNSNLEIELTNGKIRGIDIYGNKITNNDVILREIRIDNNSPVKRNELSVSIMNVMSTNLFKQVSFDFNFKKNILKPDLRVKLIEKNTQALRFSVKVDNERNLQLLLDLRDENIWGTGIETGILAAGGLRNRIYEFEIKSNQFFRLPLTFNYNLYYKFRDINRYRQMIDSTANEFDVTKIGEYRDIKNGMSFLFGTQLERFGTVFGQAFIVNQEIKNKFDSENLSEKFRVIKLKFGGTFDTQDVLPFPTSGTLINFYYESAKDILKGQLSYTKLYLNYDQHFSIAKSQTIRPRFIFGFADRTTPLTEQFSLGGEKSFFGMVEDELRGRQILETSLEYRYLFPFKIFFDTYLSIRYDLGNIWQVTEDIRFKDLRHGLGISTSFDTPVGEASFSVGRSFLIKRGLKEDSFIFGPYDFYFSIGYDI